MREVLSVLLVLVLLAISAAFIVGLIKPATLKNKDGKIPSRKSLGWTFAGFFVVMSVLIGLIAPPTEEQGNSRAKETSTTQVADQKAIDEEQQRQQEELEQKQREDQEKKDQEAAAEAKRLEAEKAQKDAEAAAVAAQKAAVKPKQQAVQPAPQQTSGSCTIKGNISSSKEKIYHMPGQRHYDDTTISADKGERWFCSETEAVNAGWRKSKV